MAKKKTNTPKTPPQPADSKTPQKEKTSEQ